MTELLNAPVLEAPTQETAVPPLPARDLRRAHSIVERPEPGHYLAVDQGEGVVFLALEREHTRIGRSPAADVVFDDSSISRRHAILARRGDTTVILDDRSLNGVFVNGERIGEAALRDGDEVALGRVRLRFVDVPA